MEFENFFTLSKSEDKRYFDCDDYESNVIFPCNIDIYGIPSDIDEEIIMYDDSECALKIGNISGYMILAKDIEDRGIDIHDLCGSIDADLEFVCSALQEGGGPAEKEEIFYDYNMFYIHEIEIDSKYMTKELFSKIVSELPEILLYHYHVCPEMLIYYPVPLEYDRCMDELQQRIAEAALSESLKHLYGDDETDDDTPHLVMSPDQLNRAMGKRVQGESYPESAKDKPLWEMYESNGFKEWLNTRVLYNFCYEL